MCGRYSLFDEQDNAEIRRIIEEVNRKYPSQQIQTGEIFPTNTVPILLSQNQSLVPDLAAWGFPKFQGSGVIINARAETAGEKKTFRDSFMYRRCVIPSTGFYEWDKHKKKYLFRLPQEKTLYMGGIFKEIKGERRYVILTTAANSSMKDVHNRMPIILTKEKLHAWTTDTDAALQFLSARMPDLSKTE